MPFRRQAQAERADGLTRLNFSRTDGNLDRARTGLREACRKAYYTTDSAPTKGLHTLRRCEQGWRHESCLVRAVPGTDRMHRPA